MLVSAEFYVVQKPPIITIKERYSYVNPTLAENCDEILEGNNIKKSPVLLFSSRAS